MLTSAGPAPRLRHAARAAAQTQAYADAIWRYQVGPPGSQTRQNNQPANAAFHPRRAPDAADRGPLAAGLQPASSDDVPAQPCQPRWDSQPRVAPCYAMSPDIGPRMRSGVSPARGSARAGRRSQSSRHAGRPRRGARAAAGSGALRGVTLFRSYRGASPHPPRAPPCPPLPAALPPSRAPVLPSRLSPH